MRRGLLTAAGIGALLAGGSAQADTLREALIRTYNTNPTLTGQRAQLRSLDENVGIAKSQGRPQVSASAGLNQDITRSRASVGRNFNAGVDLTVPLYSGGSVVNSIRAADERVLGGRATLRAVEGDTFTEAVAAYMDVIRDRSVVTLNRNQVSVLETNLQASRDRFEVGDLTRTDVAQSEARLSIARSDLTVAEGQLVASEENYRRVIGTVPDELEPPPPLPPLPATADDSTTVALANNSDIAAIAAEARAAGLDVSVARAGRLPTVNALGSFSYTNFLGTADEQFGGTGNFNDQTSSAAGLQARIPLYQGGLVGARVRQAQAQQSRIMEQMVATERSVIANARSAFAAYEASLEAIQSNEVAVAANTLALEGTRAEQTVGTRNVLDVLNAEQELLNSQVRLVTARRNAYVAGFALLNAMGQAEIEDLNLDGGYIYDPLANYRRVANRLGDWSDDPAPQPVATRTVEGPPAPASIRPEGKVRDITVPPGANTPVTETPQ